MLHDLGRRFFSALYTYLPPCNPRDCQVLQSSSPASPGHLQRRLQPPASRKTMTARLALLERFVENDCIPAEPVFAREMDEIEGRKGSRWKEIPPVLTSLKSRARSLGLWNLFMPKVQLQYHSLHQQPMSSLQLHGVSSLHSSSTYCISSISYCPKVPYMHTAVTRQPRTKNVWGIVRSHYFKVCIPATAVNQSYVPARHPSWFSISFRMIIGIRVTRI